MMKTLFLQAPSFEGFDGGAGARYQNRREIKSFWYPTWLAQPAALVEGSKLIDAPPHRLGLADVAAGGEGPRSRRAAHLDAVVCLRREDRPRAEGSQSQSQDRHDRRQGRGRCRRARLQACQELDFVAPQRVRFHHQGGRRRPRLRRHQRPVVSRRRRPHRSQQGARRSCTTWTSCRSSRRSTSATSRSRTTSSAICGTRICRSTPGAAANRAAPSACGRRPSAATTTARAASATSSTS